MTDFFNLTEVKARGWSQKLIDDILGDPDKLKRNPVYRSAAPVKLWDRARVEAAETLEAFTSYQGRRSKLSAGSKAAAERKRRELFAEIEKMAVHVHILPVETVTKKAVAHWENRQWDRGNFECDAADASEETKQRWAVNYIRHHLCNYDGELERIAGRIGINDAVSMIRRKVYKAIAVAYPDLAEECSRQAEARGIEA